MQTKCEVESLLYFFTEKICLFFFPLVCIGLAKKLFRFSIQLHEKFKSTFWATQYLSLVQEGGRLGALTQQERKPASGSINKKAFERMMHTILYKEGLKSDLSDMETWRTLFFFLLLSISGMIRIKTLTGVTFTGEKARRGERIHTSLSTVC